MSDEKKNIDVKDAVPAADSRDRLRAASQRLTLHKGGISASHVSEDEREQRAREAKAKMRENIERAGKEAAQRRELADSKNEYRQGVLERESKRSEAQRRERERLEASERLERARKIEEERELYLKREREENARISEGVLSILNKRGASETASGKATVSVASESTLDEGVPAVDIEKPEILSDKGSSPIETDETVLEAPAIVGDAETAEAVESDSHEAETKPCEVESDSREAETKPCEIESDSGEAESASDKDDDGAGEEKITLTVGDGASADSRGKDVRDGGEMLLHIGTHAVRAPSRSGVSMSGDNLVIDPSAAYAYDPYPHTRVDFSAELHAAEERHLLRRREAVSVAAGIYSEELRLLAEEEARYAAEIAEIKARRSEYSEYLSELDGRELIYGERVDSQPIKSATRVDVSSDEHAREFEEHNDSDLAGRRVGEEDMLREYEKYVDSIDRGARDTSEPRPAGEALPYTREAEHADVSADVPRYEETDYDPYTEPTASHAEPYAVELGGYLPTGYGTDHDRNAVREYEAEMARRRSAELKSSERSEKAREELADTDREHLEDAEKSAHAYRSEGLDLYARSRLSKRIDAFYKSSDMLLKREKKLISNQAKASPEENALIIVEKLAIAKELCEMAADVLGACVYVGSRARTGKHKRILSSYIDKYNLLCDEYERQTGRAVDRVDQSMVDDVMAGRLYQPIQNVYYHGMEDDPTHSGLTPELEREQRLETEETLVAEEYARYVEDGAYPEQTVGEKRAAAKKRSERMGAVRRAAERDLLLISLRAEHRISSLEAKRDVLLYSFDIDKKDRQREIRKIEKQIAKIRSAERKAYDLERQDNSRYYYLTALPLAEEKVKKGARRDRLEALRLRLDVLLAERESINERLIALYGGSDSRFKKARVARKAGKIRKRAARSMFRRQRELARKIDKIRAPIDMKERAIELLNKRIAAASEYESARYTLGTLRPGGRAREELLRTVKRAKRSMRSYEREIKYMIKKLKRHEEKYRSDREWAGFLIAITVLAGLAVAGWMVFGDRIIAYFSELKAYFGL